MRNGMNNMFSNFNNIGGTYTPNPFQPNFPEPPVNNKIESVNPNKPYEIKNSDGTIKGYFWYYGNSIRLNFDFGDDSYVTLESLGGQYISLKQFLATLTFIGTIYDFRQEPVLKFSNNPLLADNNLQISIPEENSLEGVCVTIELDSELSSKLVKGFYRIDLTATAPNGYNETVFDTDACIFEVR